MPSSVPPSPEKETQWIARARDALAAIAGAAAIVYVAGGLIVALRMYLAGLPVTAVVGQLSRNVLLSVALGEALAPALFVAAVYAGIRSAIYGKSSKLLDRVRERVYGHQGRSLVNRLHDRTWAEVGNVKQWLVYLGRTFAFAALIVTPAIISASRNQPGITSDSHLRGALIVLGVIAWLGMVLYPNLRSLIAKTYPNDFRSIPATVLHSMLLALVLIPGFVAFWGTRPLDEAVLCTTAASGSPPELRGYLVGQTGDDAYIGEASGPDRRVISIPTALIRRVIIGPKAITDAKCPVG